MARSYQNTSQDAIRLISKAPMDVSSYAQFGDWMKKSTSVFVTCFFIGLVAGCSNTTESAKESVMPALVNTATANSDVVDTAAIVDGNVSSNPIQPIDDQNTAPAFVELSTDDVVVIASFDNDLASLLATDFIIDNDQIVPTTGWICTDSLSRNRIYYFYQQGVLDANRNVAIERTLNSNSTHSDISFFWSVVASDAILLTSVNTDDNGMLLSSGRQYDVNSIRFGEVESVQTLSAESVLRGNLVCGKYDFS